MVEARGEEGAIKWGKVSFCAAGVTRREDNRQRLRPDTKRDYCIFFLIAGHD